MSSLQEQLNQISWEALEHAYGSATDTPIHLLTLLSKDERERDNALERLWASICHQGSVYQASAAAAPFLIQILEQVPDEQKPPLLDLLDGMKLSLSVVGDRIAVFLSLLQSTNPATVRSTLILLSAFQELNQTIVPALMAFISERDNPTLKALALRGLGNLLSEQAPEWEEYKQLIALPPDQVLSSVRFAAAETFAKYHPSEATPEIIDILIENMLKPYSLELQVLSLLGMPKGWQALIRLLERGAPNWILLDTIRVAEAVLDMVFFGEWVEGRFWNYRSKRYGSALLKAHEIAGGEPPDSPEIENIPDLSEGAATYRLHYGITNSYPPQPDDLLISVWGYDSVKAKKLSQLYEREGVAALSVDQKEALRVVLCCEPLWQYQHNLLEIYGLPITQCELTAFLLAGKTA